MALNGCPKQANVKNLGPFFCRACVLTGTKAEGGNGAKQVLSGNELTRWPITSRSCAK